MSQGGASHANDSNPDDHKIDESNESSDTPQNDDTVFPTKQETSADRDRRDAEDAEMSKLEFAKKTIMDLVWPDLILSHLDWSSVKTILRSWAMMWALTILQICDKTESFMGPSSFLATFAAGIEISGSLSVSSALVYCTADVVSVVFAFLISVVTLAINWHIHGSLSEEDVISDLVARNYCNSDTVLTFEGCIVPNLHRGAYLDIRTTAVTVFGMLFSFTICGYFQCTSKYFRLAWLLNSLYTIIVFPFNNFSPLWKPWYYARNALVPMCIAFAMRFAVSIIIFPFSSNHKVVSNLSTACDKLVETCEKVRELSLKHSPLEDDFAEKFSFINTETQRIFSQHIVNEIDMEMVSHLEVWFSRFDKTDLVELQSQTRIIMSAVASFNFFYEAMANRFTEIRNGAPYKHIEPIFVDEEHVIKHRHLPSFLRKELGKTWKTTSAFEASRRHNYVNNNYSNVDKSEDNFDFYSMMSDTKVDTVEQLDEEFADIVRSYEPLQSISCALLKVTARWLQLTSTAISFQHKEKCEIQDSCREEMEKLIEKLNVEISSVRKNVVAKDQLFALHGYVCRHFSRRVRRLARGCLALHSYRPDPILVWPHNTDGSKISTNIVDIGDMENYPDLVDGPITSEFTSFSHLRQVQARNPDSSPPRKFWHFFGIFVENIECLVYNGDLLFSLKRAVLTTATLVPYFVRPICEKAFKHWFLWVAVLTTYTVARQAVDGIYGFFGKLVFNFFGCLVGMIGWYISAGSGRGNPFGYAAVTAFVWLYICYQRQFNKHFTPSTSIVYSCTVTLVLGNSWNAGHLSLVGVDLGRGFSVAWIRFVTVTIGISISFIGTIFPYVFTAKKAVREVIGSCLENLGELQSMVTNFGVQRYRVKSTRIVAHTDVVTKAARAIISNLNSAEALRKRLIYEPPLSGIYPSHRYKLLIRYVREMTLVYSLIYSFLDDIEDTSQIGDVLTMMGWTDPKLCSEVFSLLYMTGRALIDGKALPSVSVGNLTDQYIFDLLKKHYSLARLRVKHPGRNEHKITATALSLEIYKRLDVVIMLIKELVGEVYDVNMNVFDLEKQDISPLLSGSLESTDSRIVF